MRAPTISFTIIVLSAVSSVNYGFPYNTLTSSTVADTIELSTNHDASLDVDHTSFTSTTPSIDERHAVGAEATPPPELSTAGTDAHDGMTSTGGRVGDVGGVGRPVADLTQVTNDESDKHTDDIAVVNDGFPWWSLMLILLATIVIILAIAIPIVLYNRRLNHRRAVLKNSKRASEVIVDSWMAASQSSIPGVSSTTVSSESGIDVDGDGGRIRSPDARRAPESNWLLMSATDVDSHEGILGAEGGFDNVSL